jgi:Protein of unknown function (DUF2971)
MPRFIYKYFSLDLENSLSKKKLTDIVLKSQIWLSSPLGFNDPFDFRALVTLTENPQKKRRFFEDSAKLVTEKGPRYQKRLDDAIRWLTEETINNPNFINDKFNRSLDKFGACCFSRDPRNILMWAHYSQSHTGVCLQFEVARDINIFAKLNKVNYRKDYPKLIWPYAEDDLVEKVIHSKYDIWTYEQEMRYVKPNGANTSLQFRCDALTGVILGANFPDSSLDYIKSIFKERKVKFLPGLKVYKAKCNQNDYKMSLFSESLK